MTDETPIDVGAAVAEIEEHRSNRPVVWLLIVLGTIVMVLSTLNTWVERQLLDTDAWVDASTALLDDEDVLESQPVRVVWEQANREAHEAVVAIVEDDVSDNVSTSGGTVVVDLGGVLVQVGEQIGLPQGCSTRSPTMPASSRSSTRTGWSQLRALSR